MLSPVKPADGLGVRGALCVAVCLRVFREISAGFLEIAAAGRVLGVYAGHECVRGCVCVLLVGCPCLPFLDCLVGARRLLRELEQRCSGAEDRPQDAGVPAPDDAGKLPDERVDSCAVRVLSR